MKRNLALIVFLYSISLFAKTEDVLASIEADMSHFTNVATITKQNESYQPYIISVFKGEELEKLGVSNLKQAIELVPGVDITTDDFNNQTPIFRGSNPIAYGQTKLFIDGVLVNNLFFDSFSEYLGMPIEMIKRVEVVRGPGSKTEGFNAYAGSINVITYAEDFEGFESKDKVVFKRGSYNYRMGGFVKSFKKDDFKALIDFYYQEDDKKLYAGIDGYSTGSMTIPGLYDNTGLAQTGYAPVWLRDYSLGINLTYKDFSLKARALDHAQGSSYGINLSLPEHRDRMKLPSYYAELGYNKKINDFDVDLKAGVKYDAFDSKAKLAPNGLQFMDYEKFLNGGGITDVNFTNGIYGEHLAEQRTLYQSSYLKYSGIDDHIITTGYRLIQEKTVDMISKLSNWSTGDTALVDYTERLPFFDKNAKRSIHIFLLQDDYTINDKLSLLYGFNYETTTYKDAGFEPRISMVYKLDTNNIFKAMYSRAHRNPSWQEMFTKNNAARTGSTDLKPEKVDAFELAYVKKFSNDTYMQSNLFYLLNKDQIYNSATNPLYMNVLDTKLYGVELEYSDKLSMSDSIYLNYSYVNGSSKIKNGASGIPLANVAHHMAKGFITHKLNNDISLSSIAKYVGPKTRASIDGRQKVEDYITVDASLYYRNSKYDYTVMLSAKNIFDEKVKYPSTPNTYTEDYAQEGRSFLITVTKEF